MIDILFLFISIVDTIAFVVLIVVAFIVWIEDMKFKRELKKEMKKFREWLNGKGDA